MPRLLLGLAALIVGYTAYALMVLANGVRHGTEPAGLFVWAAFVSTLFLIVAALMARIARNRLRSATGRSSGVVNWALLAWTPVALFLVGYGLQGSDAGFILGFGGIFIGAVLAPATRPELLGSTVSVQGIRVSAGVAIIFWPPFLCAFFLAFRTHHRVLAAILATLSVPLFRALDLASRRLLRRFRQRRLGNAVAD